MGLAEKIFLFLKQINENCVGLLYADGLNLDLIAPMPTEPNHRRADTISRIGFKLNSQLYYIDVREMWYSFVPWKYIYKLEIMLLCGQRPLNRNDDSIAMNICRYD